MKNKTIISNEGRLKGKECRVFKYIGSESFFCVRDLSEAMRTSAYTKSNYLSMDNIFVICWLFEGGGSGTIDGIPYKIGKDSIIFLSPQQLHYSKGVMPMDGRVILFSEDYLELFHYYPAQRIKYLLFQRLNVIALCNTLKRKKLETEWDALCQEVCDKPNVENKNHRLASLLFLFLDDLLEVAKEQKILDTFKNGKSLTLNADIVEKFTKLVETKFMEKVSIRSLCRQIGISQSLLEKSTRLVLGKTPLAVLIDYKMAHAKNEILSTAFSVIEIAERHGFRDESYFIRLFQKYFGQTPLQYRKSHQLCLECGFMHGMGV